MLSTNMKQISDSFQSSSTLTLRSTIPSLLDSKPSFSSLKLVNQLLSLAHLDKKTCDLPSDQPYTFAQASQPVMQVLIAPSGFKESLEPHEVADCIEEGIRRVVPHAVARKVPLVDGGEGFAQALVSVTEGKIENLTVTGPVGKTVMSHYGFMGGERPKTAVIEMAAAAGLSRVPRDSRDPTITTTYGVGELILDALEEGAERIVVGCGDSGTSDGGAGMLQALGAKLLDAHGQHLARAGGGRTLKELVDIDLSGLHPRLKEVRIEAVCNWNNVLCGPMGVARVYGPQKGATPEQVELLATALDNYAAVIERNMDLNISLAPGSGASGGLGAGLLVLGAQLRPRYEAISHYFDFERLFEDCDLVFTAEGGIDFQTPQGKMPAEIAQRAKKYGLPVITLAGTVGPGAELNYNVGIDAFASILQRPTSLEDAIKDAERLVKDSAEAAMRMVMVGRTMASRPSTPRVPLQD